MKKTSLIVLLGCLTLLSACTKEVPYDYETKEKVQNKGDISTSEDYLYTASLADSSRHTVESTAFMFGDNKRVQLQWTENALKIVEKERDQRFSNSVNDKTILEIPVEHLDYECAKDAYGDCTNKETQSDKNWSQRGSYKIKFEAAKQGTIETLPILLDQALGSKCYQEVSSEVKSFEITSTSINIQVLRNYQQNIECIKSFDNSLTETNASAVFHYSLVKASSVLSPDFKSVSYPAKDENTFGFFSNTYKQRDIDDNLVQNREKTVMNHWNPNRKVIDYHLSDSFNKSEHKELKKATYKAVDMMNEGLAKAGVQLSIKLHEPSGKIPGDIRNSMIVLAEDPYTGAPLGYGPQTEDPVTGEIISARTIMYLAGLKQYVRLNYDEIGRAIENRKRAAAAKLAKENEEPGDGGELILEEGDGSEQARIKHAQSVLNSLSNKVTRPAQKKTIAKGGGHMTGSLKNQLGSLRNYTTRISEEYSKRDAKAYIKYLHEAKNCAFRKDPSPATEIRQEIMDTVANKFAVNGKLKPWVSLSDSEKQEVIDLLAPDIWLVTLLHELGHNMGLRHNFGGSEDKANFYSRNELAAMNINHEIPYSSVMEYGDDLRALPVLGKYDIAALKYAYARKVDVVEDGKVVEVPVVNTLESIKSPLVKYRYCTDEHVGPNAGCRRFDEGQGFSEIASYLINTYNNRYSFYSTRNGMDDFSAMENKNHALRQLSRFKGMRTFVEIYERIKHDNGLQDDSPEMTEEADLADLKNAALMVNRFLIGVIQTPDLQCVVTRENPETKEEEVIFNGSINEINKDAYDCWTIRFNPGYKAIAQAGKSLNDRKHPENPSSYIDQIDTRGYWLDKWAAAHALFDRDISANFNDYFDNAWDIKDMQPELSKLIVGMLTNKMVIPVTYTFDDGSEYTTPRKIDFHASHLVKQSLDEKVAKTLEIPESDAYFSEILAGIIAGPANVSKNNLESANTLRSAVSVKRVEQLNDATPAGFLSLQVGSTTVYAAQENVVGSGLIMDANFQRTFGAIEEKVLSKLALFLSENLKNETVVTAEALKKAVPELSEQLQAYVVKVSQGNLMALTEKLLSLINGQILPEADIVKILFGLPNLEDSKKLSIAK